MGRVRLSVAAGFLLVIAVMGLASTGPARAQTGSDYQRNLTTCQYGNYGCDMSRVSAADMPMIQRAAYQRNLTTCQYGNHGCDLSRVDAADMPRVQQAAYQRNLNACRYGNSGCDANAISGADWAALPQTGQAAVVYPSPALPNVTPPVVGCAENGSCYGDISGATGRARTVAVSGYYRSDGTYVRGHYRSPPRRR